jgi:hypothetical protein
MMMIGVPLLICRGAAINSGTLATVAGSRVSSNAGLSGGLGNKLLAAHVAVDAMQIAMPRRLQHRFLTIFSRPFAHTAGFWE